jgi:hypothetical protein
MRMPCSLHAFRMRRRLSVPALCPARARQIAPPRPAAVPVHDNCQMPDAVARCRLCGDHVLVYADRAVAEPTLEGCY